MGMFDTVSFECPHCKKTTSYQSKCGPNTLEEYTLAEPGFSDAPASVLEDLVWSSSNGYVSCDHCRKKLKVDVQVRISWARIRAVDDDD